MSVYTKGTRVKIVNRSMDDNAVKHNNQYGIVQKLLCGKFTSTEIYQVKVDGVTGIVCFDHCDLDLASTVDRPIGRKIL